MSEEAGTYLGRTVGGDTVRHIETLEVMLRVERRHLGVWQGGGVPGATPAYTRRALVVYNARVAALEAVIALIGDHGIEIEPVASGLSGANGASGETTKGDEG